MPEDDNVSKAEFAMYIKGVNGDLSDIKVAVATLTDGMNRRFDALDAKFETERQVGREGNQRIHKRIDGVNKNLAGEVAGISKAVAKVREGHWSRSTAAIVAVLSAACTGLLVAFITKL